MSGPESAKAPARAATVLITGASSGIGRALALAYAQPGVELRLIGRDAARLETVAQACRAEGAGVEAVVLDTREREALAGCILAWDAARPIDLAIACAGITTGTGPGRPIDTPEATRALMQINVDGTFNTLLPLLGPMTGRRSGHVAVVGSLCGLRGFPSSPAYSAAKAALHAWCEGMRPRLRPYNVAVSVIAPGFVTTPLNTRIVAPRPLEMSPIEAARLIRQGLDRRRPMIAFPWLLYAGLRLLNLLPARLGDWILDRADINVPETSERERDKG